MDNVTKLAEFIDQHKTCDEEVEFFLAFLKFVLNEEWKQA